ncbi:MAG: baeRF3 domain-containing protein [Sphingobacteriaceae bacterium]
MHTLDQELLQKLTKVSNTACISIYMPTHNVLPENAADSLLFKNLLKKGLQYGQEKKLAEHENLLKKLQPFIDDNSFWERGQDEGLAIFVSAEETIVVRLPIKVDEQICLADTFCVKPLFWLLQQNRNYYLLGLSLDDISFYRGDRYHLEPVDIDGKIPQSMTEALGEELNQNHLHGAPADSVGMHGYMEKSQEEDIDMVRFFRQIDQSILEHFPLPKGVPLLLAALPEHHSHFLGLSKNQSLSEVHVQVNPQSVDRAALLTKIDQIFIDRFEQRKKALLDRFHVANNEMLAHTNLGDILRDCIDGKVEIMGIERRRVVNGILNIEDRKIKNDRDSHTDVLNELARMAFLLGGKIFVLEQQDMPSDTGAFTINRF